MTHNLHICSECLLSNLLLLLLAAENILWSLTMTTAHKAWLKTMRTSMSSMCGVITAYSANRQSLSDKDTPMHAALEHTTVAVQQGANLKQGHVYPGMRNELALFVTDFARLVKHVLPHLRLLCAAASSKETSCRTPIPDKVDFWLLWMILSTSCSSFYTVAKTCAHMPPEEKQPLWESLCVSLHDLLALMLLFTRGPIWTRMELTDDVPDSKLYLLHVLAVPVHCLRTLSMLLPEAAMRASLASLHPDVIPRMCCITTEHFTTTPSLVVQAQPAASASGKADRADAHCVQHGPIQVKELLTGLISSLALLADSGGQEQCSSSFACLQSPAVLHFTKAMLLMPRKLGPLSLRLRSAA